MKKNIVCNMKKFAAGFLTMMMLVSGLLIIPKNVSAAEENVDGIIYSDEYQMSKYWTANGTKEAPRKQGYVFGGWYAKDGENYTAIEQTVEAPVDGAYAKFVPDYVLGIKAQNEEGTVANDGKTSIRVISSLDCLDYQYVGFKVLLNNKKELLNNEGKPLETETVYSSLIIQGENGKERLTPQNLFGEKSKYISVCRINNILDKNDTLIINVRPYWITPDGTMVEGLAKYVHVEDGYNHYISVPINLITGEAIAAGMLDVTCNDSRFEFHDMEVGRIFDGMNPDEVVTSVDETTSATTVSIVGNSTKVKGDTCADGLYANVRFKDTSETYVSGTGSFLQFNVTGASFCDWSEQDVSIAESWEIQY